MSSFLRNGFTWMAAAVAAGLIAAPLAQGQIVSQSVTSSGQATSDLGPDVSFGAAFTPPAINAESQTTFGGDLTGEGVDDTNNVGIFSNTTGSVGTTARSGDPAGDVGEGISFGSAFGSPAFNTQGQTAFRGDLTGEGVNDTNNLGIFSNASGTTRSIARTGDRAGNLDEGVNFADFGDPRLNNQGRAAFRGDLTGAGVDATNNAAIFSQDASGALGARARTGDRAGDLDEGVNFAGFGDPRLNNEGRVAFRGDLTGTGVDATNNAAIFSDDETGTLRARARTGDRAGDLAEGVNFAGLDNPTINTQGRTAFRADLSGEGVDETNDSALFVEDESGNIRARARAGTEATGAGPGVNFAGFDQTAFNSRGDLAFTADLTGEGVNGTNNVGVFRQDAAGQQDLVVRTSDQAPDTEEGVGFSSFDELALNNRGETAFLANLTGEGVDEGNDRGLFAELDGRLHLIAREGGELEVAPGEFRTISGLTFRGGTENEAGQLSGFNEEGVLTFGAEFVDGTGGVFTSQVIPEPATLTLLGLGGLAMLRRRRRTA